MLLNNLLLLTALAWMTGTMFVVTYFMLVVEKLDPYTGIDLDWDYNPAVRQNDRYPTYPAQDYAYFPAVVASSQSRNTGKAHAIDQTGRLVLDIASV